MSRTLHQYFDARRASVALARQFVVSTLSLWGINGEPAEDIRLCTSELVSNALTHGTRAGHGILIRLSADDDYLRLEVHDSRDAAEHRPHVCHAGDTDTGGRGMSIVEALADDWGVEDRDPSGKIVWSRFKTVTAAQSA
ncbi:ATP-binding protein [Streptomyces sp. NPDC046985]|uniref:ATP-binding protein n=1 Tax=Streptomyces sp. NPDC046985 TaxID=3155377 RepID=UPI0033D38283